MTVVGITGTSGSGKSTVAGIIQQNYNAQIIDADQNGKLNRKKLEDIIF